MVAERIGRAQLKSGKELITPTFFRIRVVSMTGLPAVAEGK